MRISNSRDWSRWYRRGLSSVKKLILQATRVSVVVALVFPFGATVRAQSDLSAPTLVSAIFTSGNLLESDLTNQNTFMSMSLHDDLSGVATGPLMYYTSPSGKQSIAAYSYASTFDGTNYNYDLVVNWRQYSEIGTWLPTLALKDVSGNTRAYTDAELQTMGYDFRVTLTGTGDTTPEALNSISLLSSRTADISQSFGAVFQFQGNISDDLAGISYPTLSFTSPSGNQTKSAGFSLVGENPGDFTADLSFPQYSESGTWLPKIILNDAVGNTATLTNADLLARGIDLHLALTGTSDVNAPIITDLNIGLANPVVDNVANGGAVITLYATVSDDLAGMSGETNLKYTSPSGQIAGSSVTSVTNGVSQYTTYLPAYSEAGVWQPTFTVVDAVGNTDVLNGSQLTAMGFPITLNVTKNITAAAAAGDTVTSDIEGDGATTTDPVEVAITTPNAGDVSIVIVASDAVSDATNGYTFFDRQLSIVAPGAAPDNPLTLAFRIDSSKVPAGESASTLQITRNGVALGTCLNQTDADPDGCVFSRTTLSDGDILVQVHSTHASAWASGFPTHNFTFKGFKKSTKDYPKLNKADAGSVETVSFQVKGATDTSFMTDGYPTTQQVNCSTKALMGQPGPALASKNSFMQAGKFFEYGWKTQKAWHNTCRIFTVKVNGESQSHSALYEFK